MKNLEVCHMKKIKILCTVGLLSALTLIVGCSNQETVHDRFALGKNNSPVTVWLEKGDAIERNGKLIFSATESTEVELIVYGNYKIFTPNKK